MLQTEYLIIGTGPAGAALACFLASYGLKGIMISAAPGSAETPRAHITNPAALECLRDIGLETTCNQLATKGDCMLHTRWCRSMTGDEYGRIHSWGNDPMRKGDYEAASPCRHVDLPQTLLEPVLVRYATLNGFSCRFDTTFLSYTRESPDGPITSKLKDNLTGLEYEIQSKYLFGCDGARSQVLRQLQIPLIKKPGQGLAINVLVKVDLSQAIQTRMGNLHWIMQPDTEFPDFGWSCITRMVKPWDEWMFILFPTPGTGLEFNPTKEQYMKRIRELIGDDSIPADILSIAKWNINEVVAEHYSDGNIFCLGDAVHRHPPLNGLGSNTCIQDAFNLAWKIAYFEKGLAGKPLLDSFNLERQPVGHGVITRANQGLRDHVPVWKAFGMLEPTLEERTKQFNELSEASPAGAARRKALKEGIELTAHEFHGIGIEMNQRYTSDAIYLKDEKQRPSLPEDPVLEHEITTYPGSRLPHAWLNLKSPVTPISTIDLAGHGAFCLITGIGGDSWKTAAKQASEKLGIKVNAYSIGWDQDYEDVYWDWARRRQIEEDGCVLVRPDRFVAWRSQSKISNPEEKLFDVLKTILAK